MLQRGVSGQYLFLSLVNVSGASQTLASGAISGRKLMGSDPMALLSGNIIETSGGTYRANLYDWDCSGNQVGYFFTASGCLPVMINVVTIDSTSGKLWIASGPNVVVPPASLSGVWANSGLFVNVPIATISGVVANSGLYVTATASVASGSLYLASGSIFKETFASGVVGTSGSFPTAWGSSGQVLAASGSTATPPLASISGVNAVVPIATLSGVVANSGLSVSVPIATVSGITVAAVSVTSGSLYLASGSIFKETFASGVFGTSGGLPTSWGSSGQVLAASGSTATPPIASISGVNAVVPIATLSGVVANSGLFVTATASVASGSLYLASGSIFRETLASGVLGASGGFPTAWGNSGQVLAASGSTATPPIASISGVNAVVPIATISGVIANSGLFVTVPIATISGTEVVATATVASGSLYLASGSIFKNTFASGVLGTSGGFPTAWGSSGQVFAASGSTATPPLASISGVNAVVPIDTISGTNAVVPIATISGVVANSGLFVSLPKATISGVIANSGLFVTVPIATISGTEVVATATVASGSLYLASGSVFKETFASGVFGTSGGLPTSWGSSGMVLAASGSTATPPLASISGVNAVVPIANISGTNVVLPPATISGVNAIVPPASLSGVVANSGLFASVLPANLSGVIANSGLFVTVPTATLSGVIPLSGRVFLASGTGTSAVVDSGSIAQIASTLLTISVSGDIESNAAKQSLATVILKQTSRFDSLSSGVTSGVATTYLCDGVTIKITQPIVTTLSGRPIKEIGLGT